MPNWVRNVLTITGNPYKVERLQEFVKGDEGNGFDFRKLVSPLHEDEYQKSLGEGGATPYWYAWNNEHWGTKWNSHDTEVVYATPGEVQITFETAWSQPDPIMESLVRICDQLDLDLEWRFTEEQGWGGVLQLEGGFVHTEEWSIPETHDEYELRLGECWCYHSESDDDKPFADCP